MVKQVAEPSGGDRSDRMDRLHAERHRLQAELDELTRLRVRLESNSAQSRSYQASLEAEHARLSARLAKLQTRHQEITGQLQRLNHELGQLDRELGPLAPVVESSHERMQEVRVELQRADEVLNRTRESSAELRRTIERIDAEIGFLTARPDGASHTPSGPQPTSDHSGVWAVALARARINAEAADEAARTAAALAQGAVGVPNSVPRAPTATPTPSAGPSSPTAVPDGAYPRDEVPLEITGEIDVGPPEPAPASGPADAGPSISPEELEAVGARWRRGPILAAIVGLAMAAAAAAFLTGGDPPAPPAPAEPEPPRVVGAQVEPLPPPEAPKGPAVTPTRAQTRGPKRTARSLELEPVPVSAQDQARDHGDDEGREPPRPDAVTAD